MVLWWSGVVGRGGEMDAWVNLCVFVVVSSGALGSGSRKVDGSVRRVEEIDA